MRTLAAVLLAVALPCQAQIFGSDSVGFPAGSLPFGQLDWASPRPTSKPYASLPFSVPGCYANGSSVNGVTITMARAGVKRCNTDGLDDGVEVQCAAGELCVEPNGARLEPTATEYLLNNCSAPATHATGTVPAGTYTAWVEGSGSLGLAVGTAVCSAGCPATVTQAGGPVTITIGTGGTLNATKTGTITRFFLQTGAARSSETCCNAAACNRLADNLSITSGLQASDTGFCISADFKPNPGQTWPRASTAGLWAGGTAAAANTFNLALGNPNLIWAIYNNAAAIKDRRIDATTLVAGSSHNIAGCYTSTNPRLYIDGSFVGTFNTVGDGVLASVPTTLNIGWRTSSQIFDGWVKNLKVTRVDSVSRVTSAWNRSVVCVGDSITAGTAGGITTKYPDRLWQVLKKLPTWAVNEGVSGNTTTDMLTRWNAGIKSYGYGGVVFLGGINDVRTDVAQATIRSNIDTILSDAKTRGMGVTVLTVLPFKNDAAWTAGREAERVSLNAWLTSECAAKGYTCINSSADFDDGTGAMKAAYDSGDGLHPNQTGTDRLADLVSAVLP